MAGRDTRYASPERISKGQYRTLDTFMPEFSRKAFTVNTELREQQCVFDPLRINQCLTVLFDNALHYSTSRKLIVKNGVSDKGNYILIQDGDRASPGVS
jgi:two-component system sensor histidine kinase AdeS